VIYKLSKGKAYAEVASRGGELKAYKLNGKDVLWYGDENYWAGSSPLLFPFCSGLKDGTVRFEGKPYSMGKHGFIRFMEFTPDVIEEDRIELSVQYNEETLAQYPYKFKVTVIHQISEEGFSSHFEVTNLDNRPMPYCIGGHPGFCTGNVEDWRLEMPEDEGATLYRVNENGLATPHCTDERKMTAQFDLHYSDFEKDAFLLIEPKSKYVRLVNRQSGEGVEMDIIDFNIFAVWTIYKEGSPYVCLEPWNGMPAYEDETGNFEDKPYAVILEPNQSKRVGYTVKKL